MNLASGEGYTISAQYGSGHISIPKRKVHGNVRKHRVEGRIGPGGPSWISPHIPVTLSLNNTCAVPSQCNGERVQLHFWLVDQHRHRQRNIHERLRPVTMFKTNLCPLLRLFPPSGLVMRGIVYKKFTGFKSVLVKTGVNLEVGFK